MGSRIMTSTYAKHFLILGATFFVSSVAGALSADQHIEQIRSRCGSLRDSSEQTGCFNNDITVLEQIRRRERTEQRQRASYQQVRTHAVAQNEPADTSSAADSDQGGVEPALATKPNPAVKPVPVAPAPAPAAQDAPAQAASEPAEDLEARKARAIAERDARINGAMAQFHDPSKPGSTNIEDRRTIAAEPAAPAAGAAAPAPLAGWKSPSGTGGRALESRKIPSTTPDKTLPFEKPVQIQGDGLTLSPTAEFPNGVCRTDSTGKYKCYPSLSEALGEKTESTNVTEIPKTPAVKNEVKEAKPAQAATEDATKKADKTEVAKKDDKKSSDFPEGKICHSGEDGAGYHCHESMSELEKPKRDEKAEQAAAKAAEEKALASDKSKDAGACGGWKSPMRGTHRISDCIGSKRNGSRRHAGIDLGNGQQSNTKIFSVGAGKIVQAGWMGGYGCVIQVQHDECPGPIQAYPKFASDKCVSFYAHLEQKGGKCPMSNKVGTEVNSCTNLAIMGGTGGNYPKHLHFEMRLRKQSGVRINPLVALGKEIRGASTSPGACKSSDGWLAATGMGEKTHSVGGSSKQAAARK